MGYLHRVRRALALLLLTAALAPGTWWRSRPLPRHSGTVADLNFVELEFPPPATLASDLRAFRLQKVWRIESRNRNFGGFSALLALAQGQFLALSDKGMAMWFSAPDARYRKPVLERVFDKHIRRKKGQDIESATADLSSSTVWMGLEFKNSIVRSILTNDETLIVDSEVAPSKMSDWGDNSGPESLARLQDGRFLVLREGFSGFFERRRHAALLFPSDPVEHGEGKAFTLVGPDGFSPTDMEQLPDGRVLILFRKLDWPVPPRFSIRLAIGDPQRIREGKDWRVLEVARLPESLPVDNFEGLAIKPGDDGQLVIWLISDDNSAALQATYLWKLTLDPVDLPKPSKKARGKSARPSAKN